MNEQLTTLRSEVARRMATMDYQLTTLSDFDAAALIALTGERLAVRAALALLDARIEAAQTEGGADEDA